MLRKIPKSQVDNSPYHTEFDLIVQYIAKININNLTLLPLKPVTKFHGNELK